MLFSFYFGLYTYYQSIHPFITAVQINKGTFVLYIRKIAKFNHPN